MGLFWKKKKAETGLNEPIQDLNDAFSDIPPPPAAPGFFNKKTDEHPEDLFGGQENSFPDDMPSLPKDDLSDFNKDLPDDFNNAFEDMPLTDEAQQDEIKNAVEQVQSTPELPQPQQRIPIATQTAPEPKIAQPMNIYLEPETITLEDIEKEFEEQHIEEPLPADFGIKPEPKKIVVPERNDAFELPDIKEEFHEDFDSPFTKTRISTRSFEKPIIPREKGKLFIRFDDYSKISPSIKELQSELNSTIRTLNAELNVESTQLSAFATFNSTLDKIQEKIMEIDGILFKE